MIRSKTILRQLMVLILVTALVAAVLPATADAHSYKTWNGFKYVKKGNGIYIKAYRGSKTKISIPKKINGKYVVSVDLDEEGLRSISVKKATKLKYLDVSENRLKSIYLKKNKALKKVDVSENRLTKLSVKYNTKLVDLDASENRIKSIYLKKNTKLRELDLSHNRLTKLDLSKNLSLRELDIEGNSGLGWFGMDDLSNHRYLQEVTFANGSEWERDD